MKTIYDFLKAIFVGILIFTFFFSCKKEDKVAPEQNDNMERPDSTKSPMDSTITQTWPDSSRMEQARIFPGLVGANVQRLDNETVSLNLDYHEGKKDLRVKQVSEPLFSTGLYAPAGEKITINVPETEGLSVQIGAWTDDLYEEGLQKRSPLIFVRKRLEAGENVVWNLYGGPIYILAKKPISGSVDIQVSGAVKEPDFILGETDPSQWWDEVQHTDVPWLELRSNQFAITVPRKLILSKNLNDPTSLLNAWDEGIKKDFIEWMGLENNPSNPVNQISGLPYRAVLDTQVVGNNDAHSGSPVFLENNTQNIDALLNVSKINSGDVWKTYGLFGQNNEQPDIWTWDGITKVVDHLFGVHAVHRLGKTLSDLNPDIADAVGEALAYSSGDDVKDFGDATHSTAFKLIPFIQLLDKASPAAGNGNSGYDFIPFLYRAAREVDTLSANDQEKRDFFYETLSDFMQKDTKLFFSAWGIPLSANAKNKVAAEGYDLLTTTLWTYDPVQDTGGTGHLNPYNNTSWSVVSTSSHTDPGSNAIDGDANTFWQSDWSHGATPPHSITIDMGLTLQVGSFYFMQRLDNLGVVQIKFVQVEVSNDGENWTYLKTFHLQEHPNDPKQVFRLDQQHTFRYFKLVIPTVASLYGSRDLALAEVGVNQDFGGIPPYQPQGSGPYDPVNWSISASNEQPGDGVAADAIDGDVNTYWTAQWNPGTNAPWSLTVDMKVPLKVSTFTFTERQTNGNSRVNKLEIQVSEDGTSWESLGSFNLDVNDLATQDISITPQTFRYFKVIINDGDDVGGSGYGSVTPTIAEIAVSEN